MTVQKLAIFNITDIAKRKVSIHKKNAFIFPDGTFCLSEGYIGFNPSQQLETTAQEIADKIINIPALKEYYNVQLHLLLQNGMKKEEVDAKRLYFLRDILVHYYGYCLFARVQRMDILPKLEFWDASILPDPHYFEKSATINQLRTLQALFELNKGKMMLPSWNETSIQKVLKEKREQIM